MLSESKMQPIVLTSRPAEAEIFYRDVLGLVPCGQSDGALVFAVGGDRLRIGTVESTAPSEHTVLGFAVADVDRTVAELVARGASFERFPMFAHEASGITTSPDGARVAWLRDPDGNLLSVVQFPD